MGAGELSTMLWRERELLDLLTFKLEEEHLLLTAGKTRWLQHATREVEQVMERLRDAGLGRAVEVATLASSWGCQENATLADLIEHAPDGPWREIFSAHHKALTQLTDHIRELRDTNIQFLKAAGRSVEEALGGSAPGQETYDAQGVSRPAVAAARLFDSSL